MLGMLNVILVIISVSNAGNLLYNDICATVSKSSASSRVARVECHNDSVIFDPKSQNGSLYDNDTDSWTGEIFACQCSCSPPNPPKNGQILTAGRIQHGKNLEYKCNNEERRKKIICFDGLLMMIPEFLEDDNITIAFRQKSLPEQFLNDSKDAVFQLSVNMSDWSVHETEVSNNLKYTDRHTNKDEALIYYLLNAEGFKLGTIDLKIHLNLQCGTINTWSIEIIGYAILAIMFIIIVIFIFLAYCPRLIKRCVWPPSRTNLGDISQDSNDDVVSENEGNVTELTEIEHTNHDETDPDDPLFTSYAPNAREVSPNIVEIE